MGVSVPISPEKYRQLKNISNKLHLGLKNTTEYLVLYYLQSKKSQAAGNQNMTVGQGTKIDELKDQVEGATHDLDTISADDSKILSHIVSRIYPPLNEDRDKIQSSGPVNIPRNELEEQVDSRKKTVGELSPKEFKKESNCVFCGFPTKNYAKYCSNCGNKLGGVKDRSSTF